MILAKRNPNAYAKLGALLKQARLEANLTQTEVAKLLGKTQAYVSKCELGERRIDVIELAAFAKLYRKSPSYFFPGAR
jgi:transcriptional regulator with XRE-family HTH domain